MTVKAELILTCDGCRIQKQVDLNRHFVIDGVVVEPMEQQLSDVIRWVAQHHGFVDVTNGRHICRECLNKALHK